MLIFEIKATEDKTKIYTHILYGSGKILVSFGSLAASASSKISGDGFTDYYSTRGSEGFKFVS